MPRRLVHTPPCAPAACAPLIETMNQSNERAAPGRDFNKHPAASGPPMSDAACRHQLARNGLFLPKVTTACGTNALMMTRTTGRLLGDSRVVCRRREASNRMEVEEEEEEGLE